MHYLWPFCMAGSFLCKKQHLLESLLQFITIICPATWGQIIWVEAISEDKKRIIEVPTGFRAKNRLFFDLFDLCRWWLCEFFSKHNNIFKQTQIHRKITPPLSTATLISSFLSSPAGHHFSVAINTTDHLHPLYSTLWGMFNLLFGHQFLSFYLLSNISLSYILIDYINIIYTKDLIFLASLIYREGYEI
jgi:hypothetical protein